jgi:ABC-type uncharacterized transport system permease subunit
LVLLDYINGVTRGEHMACFLVPMILAVATSVVRRTARGLAERLKLWILNALLWGGSILLALEHAWHGELVPWPPFLTAMTSPASIQIMLHEMATIGVAMTAAVTLTWATILMVSRHMAGITSLKNIERVEGLHVPR